MQRKADRMRRMVLTGLCVGLLAATGCKDRIDRPTAAAPRTVSKSIGATSVLPALPTDVAAFVDRRDGCDHFRGEEPYDAERGAFLAERMNRLCSGSDAALARLRRIHAHDKAAIAVLARFDPIE